VPFLFIVVEGEIQGSNPCGGYLFVIVQILFEPEIHFFVHAARYHGPPSARLHIASFSNFRTLADFLPPSPSLMPHFLLNFLTNCALSTQPDPPASSHFSDMPSAGA
jgi:hypothetical protein